MLINSRGNKSIMSRVIIFSYEPIFPEHGSSGPSIRNWEIAKALTRRGHKVNIAEWGHSKDYTKNEIKFIKWDEKELKDISKRFDVALIQESHAVSEYFNKIDNIPTIVNLTIPISIEAAADQIKNKEEFFVNDGLVPTALSLMKGDFFFCASERQKYFYMGMLNLLGRINPYTYDKKLIDIVPVAAPVEIPKIKENIIKGKIIPKNKRIILWPSSIFSWFDAITAIEAMEIVSKKVKDAVMVFVGADNPNVNVMTKKNVRAAKKKAKELGLLNKTIYFMNWLPYEKRTNMYLESEFAVVTYPVGPETEMSFRTRITDCLWGRLPVICTRGDSVAEIIEKEKLGITVEEKNPKELAEKIIEFLNNKQELKRISKRVDKFIREKMNWDVVIDPIDRFCKNPKIDKYKEKVTSFSIINEKEKLIQNQKSHINYLKANLDGHARNIKEMKEAFDERENEVKKRDNVIDSLNEEIKRVSEERNSEIKKRDKTIEMLEKEKNKEIKKRDSIVGEWNKEIKRINDEKNKEIKERNNMIDDLNKEIKRVSEERNSEIKKRDSLIDDLNKEIKRVNEERNKEIKKRDSVIEELNKEIKKINEEKDKEIRKRDKIIETLDEERNKEIRERNSMIDDLNKEIKRLTKEKDSIISNLSNQLQEIKSSKGYKILTKIHKVRKKMGLI